MTAAVVLVKGGDPALVGQATRQVLDRMLDGRDPAACVEELGGTTSEELDIARIVDALTTPPFLVDRRVVVVRDAGRLTASDAERLDSLLASMLEGVYLVLAAGQGTVPTSLQRRVGDVGEVVDSSVGASLRDRRAYVAARVRGADVRLDTAAQERLVTHFGEDLARLDPLLSTLAAAYGLGSAIGVEELEPFLGTTGSVPEWDLTDAITSGDAAGAIDVLHRLVGPGGRAAPAVVNVLQRHFLRLLRLDGAGVRTREEAASILSVSAYPAEKLLASARDLGTERIRRAVGLVATADADVKGETGLDATTVLEVLVARLARLQRAAGAGRRPTLRSRAGS